MDSQGIIKSVFNVPRALIGVLHVGALPGTPGSRLGIAEIAEAAVAEARIYAAAGFHGLIMENTHDRPYLKGSVGPEVAAAMAAIGIEIRRAVTLPLGVQILAGANLAAMAVAHACGAAFVRVEGLVFAHVADEGIIESSAGELLRYRRAIGADRVRVLADIKKKHSAHAITADVDLVETAKAAEFFLADGVIVSGVATGRPTDPNEVRAVSEAVNIPTLVGSGVTPENIATLAAADALIVGSSVKEGGLLVRPARRSPRSVGPECVSALAGCPAFLASAASKTAESPARTAHRFALCGLHCCSCAAVSNCWPSTSTRS
jgi:membrane complex biogenesis BtpA family protein